MSLAGSIHAVNFDWLGYSCRRRGDIVSPCDALERAQEAP